MSTIAKRIIILNVRSEGGAWDWEEICHIFLAIDAYRIENAVHRELRQYRRKINYKYNNKVVTSQECFSCGYSHAKQTLLTNVHSSNTASFQQRTDVEQFDFVL